jgi:hypothetical protein
MDNYILPYILKATFFEQPIIIPVPTYMRQRAQSTLFPVILIISLFFSWGFAHNLDPHTCIDY